MERRQEDDQHEMPRNTTCGTTPTGEENQANALFFLKIHRSIPFLLRYVENYGHQIRDDSPQRRVKIEKIKTTS